ncbi:unnamed protein product [Cochlearia groenlandica]
MRVPTPWKRLTRGVEAACYVGTVTVADGSPSISPLPPALSPKTPKPLMPESNADRHCSWMSPETKRTSLVKKTINSEAKPTKTIAKEVDGHRKKPTRHVFDDELSKTTVVEALHSL